MSIFTFPYDESYPPSLWDAPVPPTNATAGTPGTWTPANADPPATIGDLRTAIPTPTPSTAWPAGSYIVIGTGNVYWNGTDWVMGTAPAPPPPTGVTAGTPGAFTPAGSAVPATIADLRNLGSLGQTTAWTTGQHVIYGASSHAHWDGDSWETGNAP